MLIPCNVHVITTASDVRQLYAIYTHADINGTIRYVGVTPLSELFTLQDAQCNSLWSDAFAAPLTTLEIKVIALTPNEKEAFLEQRRLIGIHNPECNRKGYWIDPKRQNVQCVETGETWPTISAAAAAHGLAISALSNHLKRKPGHRTVKGRTYIRTVK
ncbi:hypothetical protein P106B_81 [Rhizobium phage vB_RglS_P106B]|uniref:Uncharacterized protein n=1 Tax=Rhizobium phage vB_RglS_P106B TaxID=1458697 RepID=W6E8Q1_9CAUD|nr:hypothetical protein P106B_81 [Rhizobium phage vB_RglS_P106B]AHJ10764.1 hypothetical protein P106B_81 [Rhizobium phage vB_RglS_P106B]